MNKEYKNFEEVLEKKLIISTYSTSKIDTKLIINQIINGIRKPELNFINNHFFVELCILSKTSSK